MKHQPLYGEVSKNPQILSSFRWKDTLLFPCIMENCTWYPLTYPPHDTPSTL
ncbi:unnamed protein product [Bacillus thuringiensis DB27]|uniref:Uncharacterized protein n=1 Tax=Bacillus thuringiensis DB27 TaxID=1431339 RepID=W8ZAZ1_BACTU|nr:unnamed protein product [Bacillus thuringiensis DB27]